MAAGASRQSLQVLSCLSICCCHMQVIYEGLGLPVCMPIATTLTKLGASMHRNHD